jgi:transposase
MDFYGYTQLKDCLVPALIRKLQEIRETLAVAAHERHTPALRWLRRWFRPRKLFSQSARFRFRPSGRKRADLDLSPDGRHIL